MKIQYDVVEDFFENAYRIARFENDEITKIISVKFDTLEEALEYSNALNKGDANEQTPQVQV